MLNQQTYQITSDTAITNNGEVVKATDIQTGDRVMVQASNDASIAKSIEINPQMRSGRDMGSKSDAVSRADG